MFGNVVGEAVRKRSHVRALQRSCLAWSFVHDSEFYSSAASQQVCGQIHCQEDAPHCVIKDPHSDLPSEGDVCLHILSGLIL